jgi:hypothetical protein
MLPISKSTFLQYQICPKDTWLRLHKPELVETFTPSEFELHLMEQGSEVEATARQLIRCGGLLPEPSFVFPRRHYRDPE